MSPFLDWLDALDKRYGAELTFQEIRRGVQALSAIYVEQRDRIDSGAALSGAGKRAAFATFYAPLHFLIVGEIVRKLHANQDVRGTILDLGCGTGSAGAAWALECDPAPKVVGVDRSVWAVQECKWTYRELGVRGKASVSDLHKLSIRPDTSVVAAFVINELNDELRSKMLDRFRNSAAVLVVEPIARRLTRWWSQWVSAFADAGGREDVWRFRLELPERLQLMDRAAGLDHRELTARSLWLPATRVKVGHRKVSHVESSGLLSQMRKAE